MISLNQIVSIEAVNGVCTVRLTGVNLQVVNGTNFSESINGAGTPHGRKPMGGWKFGNTIDGCHAEFVLVQDAMANLAPVPEGVSDEAVLMCPDILSTGFAGAD